MLMVISQKFAILNIMSMLAERRRKTKWVINSTKQPLWTQASSGINFGKELMEKMGWSAGRGLGSKEQGIQEPLQISYKNDTKGMGFKGYDDDWIEYQNQFNMLLSQLSNNGNGSAVDNLDIQKLEVKSLELKSKHSRARVHYQKFTRGKDLSNYSENDLACIFGTNKKKEKKEGKILIKTDKPGQCETSFGVTTINGGSIQDYFKKKFTFDKSESSGLLKTNETEENLSGSWFGAKAIFTSDDEGNEKLVQKRRCKKLKHKSKVNNNVYEITDNCNTPSLENEELSFLNDKNGKQKEKPKKKKAKVKAELAEIERTGKNDRNKMKISIETNKITETSYKVHESKKRKKSKTDNGETKICISEDIKKSNHFFSDEYFSTVLSKKRMKLKAEQKKSKEEKHKLKLEMEEIVNEATENLAVNEGKESKKKKHKFNLEIETSEIKETHRFQLGVADKTASEDKQLIAIKGQKQKGREKKRQCFIEGQFLDDNKLNTLYKVQSFHSEEPYAIQEKCNSGKKGKRKYIVVMEKKSKKKKHMSESEVEEINTDSFTINSDMFKQKKSKKRKHQSNSQNEFLQKKDEKPTKCDQISKCTTALSNEHISDKKKKTCFEEDPHSSETENLEEIESLYEELRILKERKKSKKDKKIHLNPEIPEEEECFDADAERKKKKQKTNPEHYTKQDVPLSEHTGEEIEKFYSNDASLEKPTDANERGVFEEMKPGKNWRENKIYECTQGMDLGMGMGNVHRGKEFIQEDCSGGKQVEVNTSRKEVINVDAEQKGEVRNGKEALDASFQQRYTTDKVLDLILWADIKEFRGSNLGNVLGYGFKKKYLRTKMR